MLTFRRLLSTLLVISLSMIACSPLEPTIQPSRPSLPVSTAKTQIAPLEIEKASPPPTIKDFQVLIHQAYPPQVLISLNLLDNCQIITDIQQTHQTDKLMLALTLEKPTTQSVCSNQPALIPLNMQGIRSGSYSVEVNGISRELEWIQEL